MNGCKVFVPLNRFGSDLSKALAMAVVSPRLAAGKTKEVVQLLSNTISNKPERYGRPQTPITNWALSVGEIPSEAHRYLKKNNDCEDQNCETKEVVEPIGLCEDEQ